MGMRSRDREPQLDLADLAASWQIHLEAERKSASTIRMYVTGVRLFLAWCAATARPPVLDRASVAAFLAGLLEAGAAPMTARARYQALQRFARWLVEEGELPADPLAGLKPPKLDERITPVLSDQQLRDLIAACSGPRLRDRRDEAIVRLLAETGLRAAECVALEVDDVDVRGGLVVVHRGKGGKARIAPFGPQTARAIDRYLRLRRGHVLAEGRALWLGDRGRGFRYDALHRQLGARARAAGIPRFSPHVLRHTAASRWLAAGGSEGGLMAVAGWSSREMLGRYARATASQRAVDEARRLALGDL
jgi:integrase